MTLTVLNQHPHFDPQLIERYARPGPRYTSYPTADHFDESFDEKAYRLCTGFSNQELIPRKLSLYFHIPFCSTVCFYCACNKIITANRQRAIPYIETLKREMALQRDLFDADRAVAQIHFGGGTPNFLSNQQLDEIMRAVSDTFIVQDDAKGEFSIEIDPRGIDRAYITGLRAAGFNRISFGVQDLDPGVQRAVNRVMPETTIVDAVESARKAQFRSINVDLIYGLPLQTPKSFSRTLDSIIEIAPDRLSVFNYAHLPERFKPQRQIDARQLPSPQQRLEILGLTIEKLTCAGYLYIGMDHFARPDDELAIAQRSGQLHRNFQGYSTHADADVIGMGSTAISQVCECYAQNEHAVDDWTAQVEAGHIPIQRGIRLGADDLIRRDIISALICNARLEYHRIELQHSVCFEEYFPSELGAMSMLEQDGLVQMSGSGIDILPAGRLLLRNICMIFDARLAPKQAAFSATI